MAVQLIKPLQINSFHQFAKICVSMGMDVIKLQVVEVFINGTYRMGCIVACDGFEVVPFLDGLYPDESLQDVEFDLNAIRRSHNTEILFNHSKNDTYEN